MHEKALRRGGFTSLPLLIISLAIIFFFRISNIIIIQLWAMEIGTYTSEEICLGLGTPGLAQVETQERGQVQPSLTLLNQESNPMFDLMSPKLNILLSNIELGIRTSKAGVGGIWGLYWRLSVAKRPGLHGQIILFNKGVRNEPEVRGGQTLLLTDSVEYHRGRGRGGGVPFEPKTEVCLKFNGQKGCRFTESGCKYCHVCQGCGEAGHGKASCTKDNWGEVFRSKPRYLWHNLWNPDSDLKLTVAEWTLTARPLPHPPITEFENRSALRNIAEHPDLFKIVTPIKVDILERLTASYPNWPFVDSVLAGLMFGFWLMKDIHWCMTNWKKFILTKEKRQFILDQVKHEQDLNKVSEPFGKTLLLGDVLHASLCCSQTSFGCMEIGEQFKCWYVFSK